MNVSFQENLHNVFSISTAVSQKRVNRALFRAVFFSFLALLSLVLASVYVPLASFPIFSATLFLVSFSLLALFLLPFQKIKQKQMNPSKLYLTKDVLLYLEPKKKEKVIERNQIDIFWHEQSENGSALFVKLKKESGGALFCFPDFSARGFRSLLEEYREV